MFKGLHDGRTGVMVPEVKDGQVTGMTLLHLRFKPVLAPEAAKAVLQAYQARYTALVDAVTEDQAPFRRHRPRGGTHDRPFDRTGCRPGPALVGLSGARSWPWAKAA